MRYAIWCPVAHSGISAATPGAHLDSSGTPLNKRNIGREHYPVEGFDLKGALELVILHLSCLLSMQIRKAKLNPYESLTLFIAKRKEWILKMTKMSHLNAKIDLHVHFLPQAYKEALLLHGGSLRDKFPTPGWDAERHLEDMAQLGIEISFLSISSPHFNFGDNAAAGVVARKSNEEGAELARRYPKNFGLFASLPLPDLNGSLAEIEYATHVLQVDGFVLPTNVRGVYLGNPVLDPVMEALNTCGAVAAIHPNRPGSIPDNVADSIPIPIMEFFFDTTRTISNLMVNGTLKRFPNIKWVVPHAGAFLPLLVDRLSAFLQYMPPQTDEPIPGVFDLLNRLYYDVAGFCVPRQLGVLLQTVDISHLVYGSDYPYTPVIGCSMLADALENTNLLSAETRHAIFRDNALKLISRRS